LSPQLRLESVGQSQPKAEEGWKNMKAYWFLTLFCIALACFQISSFSYLIKTRPRIDIIPDRLDQTFPQIHFKTDGTGHEYPKIRIYNDNFWITAYGMPLFEPDHFWEGRITDMGAFLINHGRKRTGQVYSGNPKSGRLY